MSALAAAWALATSFHVARRACVVGDCWMVVVSVVACVHERHVSGGYVETAVVTCTWLLGGHLGTPGVLCEGEGVRAPATV